MDMPADDELGTRRGERPQRAITLFQWELPRSAPRCAGKVMMEGNDPKSARRRIAEGLGGPRQSRGGEAPTLMPPGPDRVEPADDETVGAVHGVGCPEHGLESPPRLRKPGGERVRDVVIAGNCEQGTSEPSEQGPSLLELVGAAAVREIACRDHELGVDLVDQCCERFGETGRLAPPGVEVRDVKRARRHRRSRLYTRGDVRADTGDL